MQTTDIGIKTWRDEVSTRCNVVLARAMLVMPPPVAVRLQPRDREGPCGDGEMTFRCQGPRGGENERSF